MIRRWCGGALRCRAVPRWVVVLSPAIAGVAGEAACGTHLSVVMRRLMDVHDSQWVRVRAMEGYDIASDDEPVSGDPAHGGESGD